MDRVSAIREYLLYDAKTGDLRWAKSSGRVRAGALVGNPHCGGYIELSCRKYKMLAHQAAWVIMTGEWPTCQIDHKNRIKNDNRWDNLRIATPSQNAANSLARRGNKTGYKGVVKLPSGNFGAYIRLRGRKKYVGTFITARDAHEAYCSAAREQWADYARGA